MREHHDPMCETPETCRCLEERDPWGAVDALRIEVERLKDAWRAADRDHTIELQRRVQAESILRELVDTMPTCSEAYYSHWDAGSEATEAAVNRARTILYRLSDCGEENK